MLKKRKVSSGKNKEFGSAVDLRLRLLLVVIFLAATAVSVRLYVLQVAAHEQYVGLAEQQRLISTELEPERGEIFLRDEGDPYPVATNREYPTVFIVPREIADPHAVEEAIVDIFRMDRGEIREKIARKDDLYEVVRRKASDVEATRVRSAGLKGLYLQSKQYRYYPAGDLASQLVGFVGAQDDAYLGRYGVEAAWENFLRGSAGNVAQERDAAGRWIPIAPREIAPAENGASLILTINRVIQYETERILHESIERYAADGGTIIVMEPDTGKVLAMASSPAFDPNNYSQEDVARFVNPAVSSTYEPGSIIKPITMAMGLDSGKVSPTTEYVDTGHVFESGYDIRNAEDKTYGRQNMTQVLNESINTGVIYVEKLVGNKQFAEYLKRFGFGQKTGIDVPAETIGNIRQLDNSRKNLPFFTASFGQGVAVTPIQMVTAYAALANGGKLMKPQIVDMIIRPDGTRESIEPEEIHRVIRSDTSESISKMLRDVVVHGHGKRADVPGYLVGGKTGTAQVPDPDGKGYLENVNIGSFVGYAPINDPKYVVLVKMDNPKNVEWAESSAAPVFGEEMKFLLEYGKVEPTEPVKTK